MSIENGAIGFAFKLSELVSGANNEERLAALRKMSDNEILALLPEELAAYFRERPNMFKSFRLHMEGNMTADAIFADAERGEGAIMGTIEDIRALLQTGMVPKEVAEKISSVLNTISGSIDSKENAEAVKKQIEEKGFNLKLNVDSLDNLRMVMDDAHDLIMKLRGDLPKMFPENSEEYKKYEAAIAHRHSMWHKLDDLISLQFNEQFGGSADAGGNHQQNAPSTTTVQ